jgi:hypothetical protein
MGTFLLSNISLNRVHGAVTPPPSVPTGFNFTQISPGVSDVFWDTMANASSYELQWFYWITSQWETIQNTSATLYSTNTGQTSIDFRVRASGVGGTSAYSSTLTVSILA